MTSGLRFQELSLLLPPFFRPGRLPELSLFVDFAGGHGIIQPPSNGWALAGAMGGFPLAADPMRPIEVLR